MKDCVRTVRAAVAKEVGQRMPTEETTATRTKLTPQPARSDLYSSLGPDRTQIELYLCFLFYGAFRHEFVRSLACCDDLISSHLL